MKEKNNKVKAHTTYKTADGIPVPGVTTVLSLLEKPALKIWANKIGLQGISLGKYVDDKASIGTLAHKMILDYFQKHETDIKDYTPEQVSQAQNCLISFFAWEKQHKIEPVKLEYSGVNENLKYGGTFDMLAKIDDILTLIDFKTGSGIYPEYFYQLAAYDSILRQNEMLYAEKYAILNIPRAETESFKYEEKIDIEIERQIFFKLLDIYYLKKKLQGD